MSTINTAVQATATVYKNSPKATFMLGGHMRDLTMNDRIEDCVAADLKEPDQCFKSMGAVARALANPSVKVGELENQLVKRWEDPRHPLVISVDLGTGKPWTAWLYSPGSMPRVIGLSNASNEQSLLVSTPSPLGANVSVVTCPKNAAPPASSFTHVMEGEWNADRTNIECTSKRVNAYY